MDFKLRTPDYTLVSAGRTAPQAQSMPKAWSWNQRLAITVVLFVVLRWRGAVFETGGLAATPTEELVDYADVLFSSREETLRQGRSEHAQRVYHQRLSTYLARHWVCLRGCE